MFTSYICISIFLINFSYLQCSRGISHYQYQYRIIIKRCTCNFFHCTKNNLVVTKYEAILILLPSKFPWSISQNNIALQAPVATLNPCDLLGQRISPLLIVWGQDFPFSWALWHTEAFTIYLNCPCDPQMFTLLDVMSIHHSRLQIHTNMWPQTSHKYFISLPRNSQMAVWHNNGA